MSKFTIKGQDRLSHRTRRKARPSRGKKQFGVAVSMGLAQRSLLHSTVEVVWKATDEVLYRAKRMGSNRIEPERRKKRRESNANH